MSYVLSPYLLEIQRAMELVARDPRKGRACDSLRLGYRKYAAGAHVLFFRIVPDGIHVVRVLHQRMDFVRHL